MARDVPADLGHRWALWRAGIGCALDNAFRLLDSYQRLQTLRLFLCPVDFWRYAEFDAVLDVYEGERRVLDLGSPKLLGRYLAQRYGAAIHTVDVAPTLARESRVYSRGLVGMHAVRGSGVALPLADESMDFAFSVSVIEHIGGMGDMDAMRELWRVLRPGGKLVVTVPIAMAYREIWHERDAYGGQLRDETGRVFFCRVYDEPTLQERLIEATSLQLVERRVYVARDAGWYRWYHDAVDRPRTLRAVRVKMKDMAWALSKIERRDRFPVAAGEEGVAVLVFEKGG